jgi:superfamily II DNA/RNA helicase
MEAQDILTETVPVTDDTTASADTPAEATPPDVAASEADYEYPDEIDEEPAAPGFAALGLSEPILKAVAEKGYLNPTPIQAQAIPFVLMGRDVLGCAQTGTGKTAGFTLPMIDILSGSRARARMPRSLILEPTRELALQVAENFVEYGKYLKLTHALVIGGESMSDQKDLLMRGVDVLIATPGRLIDMFERGAMLLTDTRILVIDEADRMLDMGFIPDVERIVSLLPANRQTLFFSATMAPEIRRLADVFLQNPKEITVSKPASVATTITEGMVLVNDTDKREALRRLIASEDVQNALIFCNRKRDVDILYKSLTRHGFSVGALHGDMAQSVRFATLEKFKGGELRLLCCSDVAARGIDIGGLSHVFNFDAPHHAEDYVHRIGRTGRAGREGRAFTLATGEDRQNVEAIEKLTGHPIPRIVIDGLDVIDWAETDGKRGRGRGRAKPAEKKTGEKKTESRQAIPAVTAPAANAPAAASEQAVAKPARARRGRKPRAATVEDAAELPLAVLSEQPTPAPADPVSSPVADAAPMSEAPSVVEPTHTDTHRGDRSRGGRNEGRGDQHRRPEPALRLERGPRRDDRGQERRGGRGDDLGPAVLGFGEDVPAFMLVAARPHRRHTHDVNPEETES